MSKPKIVKTEVTVIEQPEIAEMPTNLVEAPVVDQPQPAAADAEWMTFAECAKLLNVRFQQVFQRAVVRNKMQWQEAGKRKIVLRADVIAWQQIRANLGK